MGDDSLATKIAEALKRAAGDSNYAGSAANAQAALAEIRNAQADELATVIASVLSSDEQLRAYIADHVGPLPLGARFESFPAGGLRETPDLYVCPSGCGFSWFRLDALDDIPLCPDDKVLLRQVKS